jgi:uncharacterized low-complexity protein
VLLASNVRVLLYRGRLRMTNMSALSLDVLFASTGGLADGTAPEFKTKEQFRMKTSRNKLKSVTALFGSAILAASGVSAASVDSQNPFAAVELDSGYLLAAKSDAEGKCGEGKCGGDADDKGDAEGKCGEGKCGGDAKSEAEGKCGEGKCGGAA